MQAIIRNLGPVKEATINIKPLTVFIGQNNTGKTWTAYLIASALSRFGLSKFVVAYNKGSIKYREVDTVLDIIAKEGTSAINLQNFLESSGTRFLNDLASLSPAWMGDFLGTDSSIIQDLHLRLDPQDIMDNWTKKLLARATIGKLTLGPKDLGTLHSRKEKGDATMKFYTLGRDSEAELPSPEIIRSFAAEGIFLAIHQALISRVIFLPPERIAYAALALSAPLNVREEIDRPEAGSVRLGFPISDLMGMLAWIRDQGNHPARLEEVKRVPDIEKYLEAAEIIKRDLLGGDIKLLQSDPELKGRRVLFQPEDSDGKTLEIPAAASLVKALSPLYLYLTYLARPGDLLVVDEPEMNLHPEAQARITELLTILVNSGIQVILTTHSPYIVDHIVNLMKASTIERPEDAAAQFYLKRPEAFISQDKVSVYLFGEKTAKNILSEDGMIDWGTFGDVSEQVSNIYFQI